MPVKGEMLTPTGSTKGQTKPSTVAHLRGILEGVRRLSMEASEVPMVSMPDVNDFNESEVQPAQSGARYSVSDLLNLREHATEYAKDHWNFAEIYDDEPRMEIRFTTDPKQSKTAISHHMDLEVDMRQIVQVYNLSDDITWPLLNTFCSKTIGIAPLSVRMMRRERPAQAMLIFHTVDEAKSFLRALPPGVRLKGRRPRFEICTSVKSLGARDEDKKDQTDENVNEENEPSGATAIVCDEDAPKKTHLQYQNPNVETKSNTEDASGWSNVSRGKKQNQKRSPQAAPKSWRSSA